MSKEESSKAKKSGEEQPTALAARRARLRSSLTTQAISAPQSTSAAAADNDKETAADHLVSTASSTSGLPITAHTDSQALELLGNIDQALSSCASHLASLQKVASKQIDELKVIAETLQHQSIPEVGLNINTLMESLTAAIEPMKAIGELVPALDRLVSISTVKNEPTTKPHLSEKQLLSSLAEQLGSSIIDAPTFKSACQAIFPDYDLNGLLHQLSELLGEQQLSGEIFQLSFAALQSAQTSPSFIPTTNVEMQSSVSWEVDHSKATFQPAEWETQPSTSEREAELERQLAEKEQELAEFKEQLDERWQQLNGAYEELRFTLQERENLLHGKEDELTEKIADLAAKESENKQLRSQMEELRDQTKEMVTDLQKQLTQKHNEEKAVRAAKAKAAPSQPGFFELFTSNQHAAENEQPTISNVAPAPNPAEQLAQANPTTKPAVAAQPLPTPTGREVSTQTMPSSQSATPPPGFASPTASFVSAAGSYGSGVRAQVFEVIVRQALAGAHWREICAVPMQINNISPEEVESEVKRRQALLKK